MSTCWSLSTIYLPSIVMEPGTPVCRRRLILRAKSYTRYRRRYSRPVDKSTGLLYVLTGTKRKPLSINYRDPQTHTTFEFLTNHFTLPAYTITELYRYRWQVELFFKWIKQHLRSKPSSAPPRTPSKRLDGRQRLCPGRHHQKTSQTDHRTLHNVTDFKHDPV